MWGNIPVGPETQGVRVVGAVGKRWLHVVARYAPLPPAARASLHRRRGVDVGRRVFIGTEVFIDDAVPSSVTLEDDVTVIAQTTILGHTYYPRHFHQLLGDEATRAETRTRPARAIGCDETARWIRPTSCRACPTSASGTITANSSPPTRHGTSAERTTCRMRSAISARTASPARWPIRSLISLKPSTSTITSESRR